MGLLDLQREINLVIFYLNYILIHVNILPYSVYTKLRVSKNVNIRYSINDCVPVFGPIGTKLLPISITANISLKYSTSDSASVREHCDRKSDLKIWVCLGVRPHPNDPNKSPNPPHKY